MKRILAVALAVAFIAMPMARVGTAHAHSQHAGVTLTVWEDLDPSSAELTDLKTLVHQWEGKQNVTVNFVGLAQPGRGGTSISTAFPLKAKSGSGPDIIYVPEDQTGQWVQAGLAARMPKNLLSASDIKKFKSGTLNAFKVNGVAYGLPNAADGTMLFYNKKLVKTVPKTWAQLEAQAKKLTHGDQYGLLFPITNFYFSAFAFNGYGAPVFQKTKGHYDYNKLGLSSPGAVSALSFLGSLTSKAALSKSADYGPMASNYTGGKLAFAITGPWEFDNFIKALGNDVGAASIPTLPNGKPSKPFIGIRGWEVNQFSQNKTMAWSLVKYLTLHDQLTTAKAEGRLPVLNKVASFSPTPLQRAAEKQFKNGVPIPNLPEMQAVWTPMASALTLVVQGRSTPKAAMAAAVQQIKAGIAKLHQ